MRLTSVTAIHLCVPVVSTAQGAFTVIKSWSVLLLLVGTTAAAQGITGDYILLKDGTEVMSVNITSAGGGRIGGSVSASYKVPFEGTINGRSVAFATKFPDGSSARWAGKIVGTTLNVTLSDPSGEHQELTLIRRGSGWTSQSPLARQWTRKLVGREIARTERTGGGSSGSAVKDMMIAFCDAGRALYQERFALNVAVPGMGGSQTSRDAHAVHWRVISSGTTAAIEISARDEEVFQMGIREGSSGVIQVAAQPMRLRDAGEKCSDPRLHDVR
ncbi:MAG TPA: hypothetical protein VIF83_12500 [Gemmatimonadaceae bacterium]